MELDSHGSTPFGQRRSQATLWPDSLRLLQIPCASILRKQNKKAFGSLESFCWCGRWDWILTARRRSVSAALRPHCGLIHYGFFKSHALRFFVSKIKKPSVLSKAFAWCGRWDLNPYVIQHTPLKRACLPIPALPHIHFLHQRCNMYIIRNPPEFVNPFFEKSFLRRFSKDAKAAFTPPSLGLFVLLFVLGLLFFGI